MIEFYQTCSICLNGYYVRDTGSKENTCPECYPAPGLARKVPVLPLADAIGPHRVVNDTLYDPLWKAYIERRGK